MPDVLPATLTGRYRIRGILGRGGAAIVYLADDRQTEAPVALKVLRPDAAAGVVVQRFMQEIRVGATLHHPNILPILDTGEVDGLPMYATRYVAGGTLRQLLDREGALPFDRVVAIARQVAAALDHAHAHGVAHRDIKPENILFEGDRAVVADFGIARAFAEAGTDRLTESGMVIGTPRYMSPEQAGGERSIDGRSDVYSLGCVVFEMLGGEPPFDGVTAKGILARHLYEAPPTLSRLRPTMPPAMEHVVVRALSKVPADRYQRAGEFADALARSVTGWSARARRRAWVAASALALALVAGVGAWAWDRFRIGRDRAASVAAASRIAVLYFDDLSPDGRLRHVAAGLTEDLIDRLSEVSALHVVSPNGVRPWRDSVVPMDSLARRLAVGTIVAGNVASSGALLRVGVRVIDPATGRQLDGRQFVRPATDLLALQDTLTTDIAFFLRQRVGREVKLRTQRAGATSTEAWELVQRAEPLTREAAALVRAGSPRATMLLLEADSLLARAERLDPRWPEPTVARARLAISLANLRPPAAGTPAPDRWAGWQASIAHAERALSRHPGLPEALAARGEAYFALVFFGGAPAVDSLLRRAEADLHAAANARPDVARNWAQLGHVYLEQGRYQDAAAAFRTAQEADAYLTDADVVLNALLFSSLQAGEFDAAARACRTARARYPGDPRFMNCEVDLLGWSSRDPHDVAVAWRKVHEIERSDSTGYATYTWAFRRMMVAAVAARSGLADSARHIVARTAAERGTRPSALVAEAYVHVLLGEHALALARLEEFARSTPRGRAPVARSRWFEPLRSAPRFRAIFAGP